MNHTLGENLDSCTGCAACAGICPESCISMVSDCEGFIQPDIDLSLCIDCGLCMKVCPVNNDNDVKTTEHDKKNGFPIVWAAWNLDAEIRCKSSSGGIFTVLAENILKKGGVVVGAAFDEDLVVKHRIISSLDELGQLRGSKYVQSIITENLYENIQELLKDGRFVLFSGTPCQVAGILRMLRKPYDKLLCCDVLCHGVPSPKLFKSYIRENFEKEGDLKKIVFRDKTKGWKHFNVGCDFKGGRRMLFPLWIDPYMLAFLRNIALRFSCYSCKFTTTVRQGDLTLGDFWGVAKKYPEYDPDDKGTSLILVNNKKGMNWLSECEESLFLGHADIETAVSGNSVLRRTVNRPMERETFYSDLDALSFKELKRKYNLHQPSFSRRIVKGGLRRLRIVFNKIERYSKR